VELRGSGIREYEREDGASEDSRGRGGVLKRTEKGGGGVWGVTSVAGVTGWTSEVQRGRGLKNLIHGDLRVGGLSPERPRTESIGSLKRIGRVGAGPLTCGSALFFFRARGKEGEKGCGLRIVGCRMQTFVEGG